TQPADPPPTMMKSKTSLCINEIGARLGFDGDRSKQLKRDHLSVRQDRAHELTHFSGPVRRLGYLTPRRRQRRPRLAPTQFDGDGGEPVVREIGVEQAQM